MKQFIYTFTPEVEGTITGILESTKKTEAKKCLKNEIKKGYQGLKYKTAMKSLRIIEIQEDFISMKKELNFKDLTLMTKCEFIIMNITGCDRKTSNLVANSILDETEKCERRD